jgi:NAD(P)H-nitrite reductase large subunit
VEEDDLLELEELREADESAWPGPGRAIVCRCHQVTEAEIEAVIAEGGGMPEIAAKTCATTGCSGCLSTVRRMLALRP